MQVPLRWPLPGGGAIQRGVVEELMKPLSRIVKRGHAPQRWWCQLFAHSEGKVLDAKMSCRRCGRVRTASVFDLPIDFVGGFHERR